MDDDSERRGPQSTGPHDRREFVHPSPTSPQMSLLLTDPQISASPTNVDAPPIDLEVLSAWAGEWLGEPEGGDDTLSQRPFHAEAVRRAHDEWSRGLSRPSSEWSNQFGLLLGLARVSQVDPVQLADGTILAEHQAEVVEATLEHLLSEHERPSSVSLADVGARKRCFFEHATGSGKTVTACALVDAARTCGVIILTHRSTLVSQFREELTTRGYGRRLVDIDDPALASHPSPVVVTTYQTFARRWDTIDPELITVALCDEVHQSLGDRTSNAIRALEEWTFIGMTATGQLLGKEVAELFPTRVSTFDLRRAASLGVISPLRSLRVQPAVGIETLRGVRVRAGDYDADELAGLLDRDALNYAVAAFYRDTFNGLSGIVYAATVRHAERLAVEFLKVGVAAAAVSGTTPRAELDRVLREFEAGRLRVIINAQLLVEGWNSPRVSVCLHLAPTASRRVYVQRIGRVTRRAPGKEAGIIVDFVPPAFAHDDRLLTLHSVLEADHYRTGELVTLPPVDVDERPEPAPVRWGEDVLVPTAAQPAQRREWLSKHLDDVTLSALPFSDRMLWAEQAGRLAVSPADLGVRLKAAQDFEEEIWLACATAALHRAESPEVRDSAFDRLMHRRDAAAFELLATLAMTTDRVAWSRRLVPHLLRLAAQGTDTDQETLLDLARTERPRYTRLVSADRRWAQRVGVGVDDTDRRSTENLLRSTLAAPAETAAAVLVITPTRFSWAESLVRHVAEERFPATSAMAEALLAAFASSKRRGQNGELVYSAR